MSAPTGTREPGLSVRASGDEAGRPGVRRRTWLFQRRWLVLAIAVTAVALAAPLALRAEERMATGGFNARGEAERADRMVAEDFAGGPPQLVVLATAPTGADSPDAVRDATALTNRLTTEPGVAEVQSYWSTGRLDELRSTDGRTGLILVRLSGDEEERTTTAQRLLPLVSATDSASLSLAATGEAAVDAALEAQTQDDLVKAEKLTAPIVLVILILVFGSLVAALLPLAVGVLTVLGTLATLYGITYVADVSIFSLNLTTAIGLGLAIDYSLFVVTRFREQLAAGDDVPTAITVMVRTAGRTVWFSALTVALGFAAPLVFPALRSLAYAGIVVSLLAATVATTVLPAVLAVLGRRIDRFDPLRRRHARRARVSLDEGFWHRLAAVVMRRPATVTVAVVALLGALAVPFASANFGLEDDRILPPAHPVHTGGQQLRADFPASAATTATVVLPGFDAQGSSGALDAYAMQLSDLPGAGRVDTSTGTYLDGERIAAPTAASARFVSASGTWLSVESEAEPYTPAGTGLVEALRELAGPQEALVGGTAAQFLDTKDEITDRLPWALLILASTTLVLLFLFTGGLLIPLKAIALNLLSLTATFGAMVYVFQLGHLQWLVGNFTPTGYIDIAMPVLIFCIAFGLSMDYEVFLLSRIAEEYRRTGDNTLAVQRGLQRTGRLVTAAAALIAVVLGAMATSGVTTLKALGVGLALAVLLDATLVRALLVPAIMKLAGRANWWAPAPLRRLHRRIGLSDG
ncbi:MMPL family transporter [Geodermatophilus sp. FMUSA9-8]|uniref:MMPL family transporter n=1 Tax=Geodermatophilus sp. FMUSA9-8 TaxID=3120155 RepID=UPI00300A926C